jgi:hypothetical protein
MQHVPHDQKCQAALLPDVHVQHMLRHVPCCHALQALTTTLRRLHCPLLHARLATTSERL